jgi:hypothetical protein
MGGGEEVAAEPAERLPEDVVDDPADGVEDAGERVGDVGRPGGEGRLGEDVRRLAAGVACIARRGAHERL